MTNIEIYGVVTSVQEVKKEKGDGEVEHQYKYVISDKHGGKINITMPNRISLPNQEVVKLTLAKDQRTLDELEE